MSGPTPARIQQGCRAAPIGGGAHTRVGLPPLPPGAAQDSQDSRAVASPIRQRAKGGQRHKKRNDLMETEPVQREALQEDNTPTRERARVGARGGLCHPDSGTTLGRGSNGAAAPLGSPTGAGTATDERRRAITTVSAEGLLSTRTSARTRIAARAGA